MSALDRMRVALAGTIAEMHEARRAATQELIGFKAGAKLMSARAAELDEEAAGWEKRAEAALRAGDEALAREALAKRGWVIAEIAQLRADGEEQARYAAQLLAERRRLDAALQGLELRQGSVAAGLAAARKGANPLAAEGDAWDRFEQAEQRIEEEAILGELSASEIDEAELAGQKIAELESTIAGDAALAELKRKMREGV